MSSGLTFFEELTLHGPDSLTTFLKDDNLRFLNRGEMSDCLTS